MQMTTYKMRMSVWISDVCSSDLPRFATAIDRARKVADCVAELERLFAGRTLADWRERLGAQDGQWDVVQHVGELKDDRQVQANGFMQRVVHDGMRSLDMVSVPIQFDGAPLPSQPRSEEHTSEITSLMRNSYAVFCLDTKN